MKSKVQEMINSLGLFDENDTLDIGTATKCKVNCRNDAAPEKDAITIPYAIFATYEMAPEYNIDVYQRVVDRIRIKEPISPLSDNSI